MLRRAPTSCRQDPPHVVPRLLVWGIVAAAVALFHNRLWASPNLDAFSRIAEQWGSDPFSDASTSDYLLTNLSMPTLARLFGATEPHRYALLHLAVLVVGCACCVALAQRQFGYRAARTLLVLLAASPGVTVVLQWLGQPDALTFPLGIALVLVRRRRSFVALAVLAGLTHPEQAVLVVACAAVVRGWVTPPGTYFDLPVPRPPWRRMPGQVLGDLGYGLLGVGAARLLIELYLRGFRIGLGRPRSDYLRLGADLLVEHHGRAPASLLYLLWGPLWLVVIAVVALRVAAAVVRGPTGTAGRGQCSACCRCWRSCRCSSPWTRHASTPCSPRRCSRVPRWCCRVSSPPCTRRGLAIGTGALLAVTLVVPGGFTAGEDAWSTQIPTEEFVRFLSTGEAPEPLFFWLLGPFDFVFPDVAGGGDG